jgi:hypothetical protein
MNSLLKVSPLGASSFFAVCVSLAAVAANKYSYEVLGSDVGAYLYNLLMRDAVSMHCPFAAPEMNVSDSQELLSWAIPLFAPADRKQAAVELESAIPALRTQSYQQARNIFVGFNYKTENERARVCTGLKETIEKSESDNLKAINNHQWKR